METTGVDLLLVAFQGLNRDEQERAFRRLTEARVERLAGEEDETARYLRSLQRVAEHLGGEVKTVSEYRRAWRELRDQGEDWVLNVNTLIRHWGSWRKAREALGLSETDSARLIEARFARRRLDRMHHYREAELRAAVGRAVQDLGGRAPRAREYEHWRKGQLELARKRGDDAMHLPGLGPFRRRWGTWKDALAHFGYDVDDG